MQNSGFNIKTFPLLFSLLLSSHQNAAAQELKVVSRLAEYRQMAEADSGQRMVEVKRFIPSVVYDLRYATPNNFTGQKLYPKANKTFVRLPVAEALRQAANELAAQGYFIKIWDAYRPYAVTQKMWALIGDERYVANPAKGSGHNRGLALDITLMKEGKEVDMGTGFDNFTDTAHHDFQNLPDAVVKNRALLRSTMEKHGFKALETEWWHYSFPNDGRYEVLDLPFRKLAY